MTFWPLILTFMVTLQIYAFHCDASSYPVVFYSPNYMSLKKKAKFDLYDLWPWLKFDLAERCPVFLLYHWTKFHCSWLTHSVYILFWNYLTNMTSVTLICMIFEHWINSVLPWVPFSTPTRLQEDLRVLYVFFSCTNIRPFSMEKKHTTVKNGN
jgi:hypothetical protein